MQKKSFFQKKIQTITNPPPTILKNLLLTVAFVATTTATLSAQKTAVFTEANAHYKQGIDFYDKGLFALAQQEFATSLQLLRPIAEPESKLIAGQAELYLAKAAIRTDQPNAETLMLDFVRNYSPDPLATQALFEVGTYYYDKKDYKKASQYLAKVPMGDLTPNQRVEAAFKKGYSFFVQKQFPQAKAEFIKVKDIQGDYYAPANYYYGMTAFFDKNFEEAIRSFQRIEKTKQYEKAIPYTLTQIYFAQKDFKKVISYGTPYATSGTVGNIKELNQLVGQAYFEQKDYNNAARHLEVGADGNAKMREEDYYQLGFAFYKVNQFQKAGKALENLSKSNTKIGQSAMYLLGDCDLKANDKQSARTAFAIASRMTFDPSITDDANFNYAKLSYELKYTQDAVNALENIGVTSKNYTEAQNLLGELLLQTRDYEGALKIIQGIQNKTPKIKEAYQKASVYRGIQLMQSGNNSTAASYFEQAISLSGDNTNKAIALYWLGDINHQTRNYSQSVNYIGQFLTMAKGLRGLPDESSIYTGNYTQGYNYLKQKNYQSALTYFQDCVNALKRDRQYLYSDFVKNNVLGDATLRAADCYFKRNRYDDALKLYNEAISGQYQGYVYALYQKGMIQGVRGNNVDKVIALEKVAEQHPNSEFAPLSLLEAGITYQQMNKLSEGSRVLQQLTKKYGTNREMMVKAYQQLGLIAVNQGNLEQAITYYKQVFAYQPSAADAKATLSNLEDIYVNELGKPDEYFSFVQTIPAYGGENLDKDQLTFKAAETQYEQGNYEKAIPNYTTYISRFPNGANIVQAYFNRAESYALTNQFAQAQADYEAVAQRGNSQYYAKALEKATLIAYNNGKDFQKSYDLATKWEAATTNEDKKFQAQLYGMRSAYRLGKTDAVYSLADKVANNARASKDQTAVASFYLGKIAYDRKELDKAMLALKKAITNGNQDEQTAEAEYLVASIDYQKRNLDEALRRCEKASQNSVSPYWAAKCTILEADIYAEKGDLVNARAALEAVRDNFTDNPDLVNEAKRKLDNLDKRSNNKPLKAKVESGLMEMDEN